MGTLLTVTGTGFSMENASIMVGSSRCVVEEVTGEEFVLVNEAEIMKDYLQMLLT